MSDETEDAEQEARIEAHRADFGALLDERITAPDGLDELLHGAARALADACGVPVYIVPISETCYALAVRGREVVKVLICGPALYDIIALDRRPVAVTREGLNRALGDAMLEALPIFVHAAFAGAPEAS